MKYQNLITVRVQEITFLCIDHQHIPLNIYFKETYAFHQVTYLSQQDWTMARSKAIIDQRDRLYFEHNRSSVSIMLTRTQTFLLILVGKEIVFRKGDRQTHRILSSSL